MLFVIDIQSFGLAENNIKLMILNIKLLCKFH